MISFVRRLNPFRRVSFPNPPPNIVTRSVQTDLDVTTPLHLDSSPSSDVDVQLPKDANTTQKGINKLLQMFQKENFTVTTLMDQNGRIFFTIDLTEIIDNDVELDNIVKMVQNSILHLSNHLLNSDYSEDFSKKLKRHFLFESVKKLNAQQKNKVSLTVSDSYYTVPEKNTESQAKSDRKPAHLVADKTKPNKNKRFCVSVDEREINSLLYEVSSTITPEEKLELIESLKSSLATKIFNKIERTVEALKLNQRINLQKLDVSVAMDRFNSPVKDRQRKVSKYSNTVENTTQKNTWDQPKHSLQRPKTRRNGEYARPRCTYSSFSSHKARVVFYKPSMSSTQDSSELKISALALPPIHNQKDKEEVVNHLTQTLVRPLKSQAMMNSKTKTRSMLVEDKRKHDRPENPKSRRGDHQDTVAMTMNKSKQKNTVSQRRPKTALEERRAKMLSRRRDVLQKYKQKNTTKKTADKDAENSDFNHQRKEILKKKLKNSNSKKRKEKSARDTDKTNREEKKHKERKEITEHRKKEEKIKHKQRNETNKHSRKAKEDFPHEGRIQAVDSGDQEVLVLHRSIEVTRRADKSKKRKSARRRTREPERRVSQVGYTSSEVYREQRRVLNNSRRRKSQRKDDLDEVRTSERLIAVVSFGHP